MPESYKTKGIVLNAIKHGETGHIVYMYTELHGRITYYVKGNRSGRPVVGKSRIVLQPLTVIDLIGCKSSRGEMHRIREATHHFLAPDIIFDIKKSSIALFMAEVVYRVLREEAPNPEFFRFFIDAIRTLNVLDRGVANFHIYFLVRLIRFLGFHPSNEYSDNAFFDIRKGEFTVMKPQHSFFLDQQTSFHFAAFIRTTPDTLEQPPLNRVERVRLLNGLIDFIGFHHDAVYRVSSLKILGELF